MGLLDEIAGPSQPNAPPAAPAAPAPAAVREPLIVHRALFLSLIRLPLSSSFSFSLILVLFLSLIFCSPLSLPTPRSWPARPRSRS